MKSGETVIVQGFNRWQSGSISLGNYETVDTDAAFAFFTENHEITPDHRIYYYYSAVSWQVGMVGPFVIHEISDTETQRLWVLLNERTGLVEDYAYRTTF
jgi:hypothetical protein